MNWYIQKDARILIAFNVAVGLAVLLWVLSLKDATTDKRWHARSISEMVLRDDSVGSPRIAFAFQVTLMLVTVWQCLSWYLSRANKMGAHGSIAGIWASFFIATCSSIATAVLTIAKEPTGHLVSASLMFLSYWLCLAFLARYLHAVNRNMWSTFTLLCLALVACTLFAVANEPVFEYLTVLLLFGVLWMLADAGQKHCFMVLAPVVVEVHGLRL